MSLSTQFLVALFFLSVTGAATAKTSQEIINDCWAGGAHPAMAACVERYAKAANIALTEVETAMRKNIAATRESHTYVAKANKAFELSITSFRAHRFAECGFREVLSSAGNASDSVKSACEAELNENRAAELARTYLPGTK